MQQPNQNQRNSITTSLSVLCIRKIACLLSMSRTRKHGNDKSKNQKNQGNDTHHIAEHYSRGRLCLAVHAHWFCVFGSCFFCVKRLQLVKFGKHISVELGILFVDFFHLLLQNLVLKLHIPISGINF